MFIGYGRNVLEFRPRSSNGRRHPLDTIFNLGGGARSMDLLIHLINPLLELQNYEYSGAYARRRSHPDIA
jgi:hypothetical protein